MLGGRWLVYGDHKMEKPKANADKKSNFIRVKAALEVSTVVTKKYDSVKYQNTQISTKCFELITSKTTKHFYCYFCNYCSYLLQCTHTTMLLLLLLLQPHYNCTTKNNQMCFIWKDYFLQTFS